MKVNVRVAKAGSLLSRAFNILFYNDFITNILFYFQSEVPRSFILIWFNSNGLIK